MLEAHSAIRGCNLFIIILQFERLKPREHQSQYHNKYISCSMLWYIEYNRKLIGVSVVSECYVCVWVCVVCIWMYFVCISCPGEFLFKGSTYLCTYWDWGAVVAKPELDVSYGLEKRGFLFSSNFRPACFLLILICFVLFACANIDLFHSCNFFVFLNKFHKKSIIIGRTSDYTFDNYERNEICLI